MYDTIIIGAGMSGLAAGIRLAYYNQKVCILERHYTIGGLNSFYRLRGRDYDVGLHAVTNFSPKGAKKGPLARILRQLRFAWGDFSLAQQRGSAIRFPGCELKFTNDLALLTSEIERAFPRERDRFQRLLGNILDYDDLTQENFGGSARAFLGERIEDPLLREMILCPLMWYGNAREDDMDVGQFCIMFRSIFMEGFARPYEGVRLILKLLVKKFRELGGELKLRHGVDRIKTEGDRAVGVVLDDGRELEGRRILSSAGYFETLRMCDKPIELDDSRGGKMTFIETVSILDKKPTEIGHPETIVFYNDSERFRWRPPERDLCDPSTGVICSPNNFAYTSEEGEIPEGVVRVTTIADFRRWLELSDTDYALAKLHWYDRASASAARFMPDFRRHVIDTDMFTPKTIHRFTWHDRGAVYGAPDKRLDGTTHLGNLFLCGTDQGYVGIIGAMMSGLSMANKHCLKTDEITS